MPTSRLLARALIAGSLWQSRLRRSARLYLAMNDPSVQPLQVEARLRLVERKLLHQLLRAKSGARPLASTLQGARAIMEAAQTALLKSETEVAALLAELSAAEAVNSSERLYNERLY